MGGSIGLAERAIVLPHESRVSHSSPLPHGGSSEVLPWLTQG